jgi:sugar O-acyltransferase (sialic acid O-acetyltransferase NeuD family)
MIDVVIVGASGLAREIFQWAQAALDPAEYRIKGFLSNQPHELDTYELPVGILGDENTYSIQLDDRFLMALGNVDIKKRVVTTLQQRGAGPQFLTLIHPTAVIASTARIGIGAIICPFVVVSDRVDIGDFVLLNFYASCGHDAKIGRYTILSPYATVGGWSVVADEVYLSPHVTVAHRKTVGYQAKISANSAVMEDVPPYAFVYGVPGKRQIIFKAD